MPLINIDDQTVERICDGCTTKVVEGQPIMRWLDPNDAHDYWLCVPCHSLLSRQAHYVAPTLCPEHGFINCCIH